MNRVEKQARRVKAGGAALKLVERPDDDPRVDTRAISEALGVKHVNTIELIDSYATELETLGVLRFETGKPSVKGGRPERYALLNEDQSIFLLTLSRNTAQVVALKLKLTTLFSRYRRAFLREAHASERRAALDWQTARAEGKLVRKQEVEAVRQFVLYATEQGSKNAMRYYANLTRMEYNALGFLELGLGETPNLRERLNIVQLAHLQTADHLVSIALEEGMTQSLPYREVYQVAKRRVEDFARTLPPPALTAGAPLKQLLLTDSRKEG